MSGYSAYRLIELISGESMEHINAQIAQLREMSKNSTDPGQIVKLTEAMAKLIDATKR